ncbi:GNAT family N-acetyltransferase [Christiangramia sp. SM2212]|uniref:GNAT family N-acetyltransferase n=1 Tax=Christiangramia sediminicola TaxID=3073267 RepID=A0ABU1END9_9FLAO|nr:GNAT family N-acetyltransferase [Christiangramia sp. SM2212]MDR5589905.1 GNAT family N-acetyltransferase [Christiangramia sp. SM2212]
MTFTPFPEIVTPRLVLREPRMEDWTVISYLRSDKEVNRFVNRSCAGTREKAIEFIQKCLDDINRDKLINWFICLKEDRRMIGTICLWNISKDRKTAEIGYDLHTTFHGFGLMNEAMKAVLKYGFDEMNLQLIEAFTHELNTRSLNLLNRNNFKWNKDRVDTENDDNVIYELKTSDFIR